ncbi:MAG: ArsC/Spx/MgsR family protein [Gammaproteobacteria bacterium]|jgi:arsenate reductase
MITVYGIRNCDKCRAALKWFDSRDAQHTFHDLRADGLALTTVQRWQRSLGDDALVNKRSTTWRGIANEDKTGLSRDGIARLMLAHPTLIKRPVVECEDRVYVGYDEAAWNVLLTNGTNSK